MVPAPFIFGYELSHVAQVDKSVVLTVNFGSPEAVLPGPSPGLRAHPGYGLCTGTLAGAAAICSMGRLSGRIGRGYEWGRV
jgi:hypothetical protein